MVAYISNRARSYVRTRATLTMTYTCRAERLQRPTYDENTLIASPSSRTTLYTGKCRLWEVQGATSINVGEADVDISSVQISLPWNSPPLKKNDEILILSALSDDNVVGKRFQVQSSAKAGELRATRRYAVMGVN